MSIYFTYLLGFSLCVNIGFSFVLGDSLVLTYYHSFHFKIYFHFHNVFLFFPAFLLFRIHRIHAFLFKCHHFVTLLLYFQVWIKLFLCYVDIVEFILWICLRFCFIFLNFLCVLCVCVCNNI